MKNTFLVGLGTLLFMVFTALSLQVKENYQTKDDVTSSLALVELAAMAEFGGEDSVGSGPAESFKCGWFTSRRGAFCKAENSNSCVNMPC